VGTLHFEDFARSKKVQECGLLALILHIFLQNLSRLKIVISAIM
jgi:hypothetical protein